jgi:hypothetical protein
MDTPPRWILRNIARRPVELHEAGGVRVIPPEGSIEVEEIGAQCAALIGRGLLTQHEAPPPAESDESEAEPATSKPRKRAAAKRGESDAEPAPAKPRKRAAAKRGASMAEPAPAKPRKRAAAKRGASKAGPAPAKPRKRAAAKRGASKKNSPQPGVAVVEDDQATGLRKGEGE